MGVGVQANPPGGALTETAPPFPGIPSAGQAGSFGSGSRAPGWLRAEVRSTPPWIPSQLPLEETVRYSTEWPANRSSSTWYFPTWSVVLLLKICGDQIGPKCWVFVSPAKARGPSAAQLPSPELGWIQLKTLQRNNFHIPLCSCSGSFLHAPHGGEFHREGEEEPLALRG